MRLVLVGTSHRLAPIEVRERMALEPERAAALSEQLAGAEGEAVCLSTCNRTELYLAHEDAPAAERLAEEAGIHRVYLAGIELAQRNPSLKNLENLAKALGITLSKLFEAD